MNNEYQQSAKKRRRIFAFLGVAYGLVIPLSVFVALLRYLPSPFSVEVFTTTFSNVVSPIFSAFAFIALVVATLMQAEALGLQQQDLKDSQKSVQHALEIQTESQKALIAQAEMLQLSARLNALSVLITTINGDLDFQSARGNQGNVDILMGQRIELEKKVKEILEKMGKSSV